MDRREPSILTAPLKIHGLARHEECRAAGFSTVLRTKNNIEFKFQGKEMNILSFP